MSDLVGNPKDRFSHNEAHIVFFSIPFPKINPHASKKYSLYNNLINLEGLNVTTFYKVHFIVPYEPCCEKTGLRGF